MRSRRDRAQAYFFLVGRLVAGVLHGEPDTLERPNRRPSLGTVIGLILAILVAAGFAIYGLLRPGGSTSWRKQTGSVILVEETGARYLLLGGQLRPVLNYTSARLVLKNGAPVTAVSRKSLSGMPVGAPIGIPGAPDGLPSADRMYSGAWTVCARPVLEAQPTVNAARIRTTLLLDDEQTPPLPEHEGLLVSTPDKTVHLVWQGRRFRLASAAVAVALGYGTLDPIPVMPAWLNPIPSGRDLAFPEVAGRGTPGLMVGGRPAVVGQVFELRNPAITTVDLYLLLSDGLAQLSRTAAALVLADPATKAAYGGTAVVPISIGPDDLSSGRLGNGAGLVAGYPPTPPRPVNDTGADLPCVRHRIVSGSGTTVTVTTVPMDSVRSATSLSGSSVGGATADEVVIPVGTGMLVRNRASPGAAPGAVYLVSESGVKFPIPDDDAVAALGYEGVAPIDVPSELLALLPTGPVLSPAAALAGQQLGG